MLSDRMLCVHNKLYYGWSLVSSRQPRFFTRGWTSNIYMLLQFFWVGQNTTSAGVVFDLVEMMHKHQGVNMSR